MLIFDNYSQHDVHVKYKSLTDFIVSVRNYGNENPIDLIVERGRCFLMKYGSITEF